MPAPRKFHGIIKAEYSSNAGSTWTEITNLVGETSGVVFEGVPDDSASDPYDNKYRDPGFRVYTVTAMDRTAYAALLTLHQGDTKFRVRWTLDQDELHTMTIDTLPQVLQWVDIEGIVAKRSNAFTLSMRVPEGKITETIA